KILETDVQTYEQEERFESDSHTAVQPRMTYALIGVCAIVFAGEVALGGATNPRTLWRMGAMMPSLVWRGEWWRIFAAQFLHYGWVHIAMNMLALYLLGPFVERELGRFRYLLLYLLSGAGAMVTIIFLTSHGMLRDDFVVGASGSILGLIGASAAVLLLGWIRHRALVARRRLVSMLLIIVLQMVFDVMTPQVSFTAHLSGAAFGFLIAGAMSLKARDTNAATLPKVTNQM
ncbi:MAG TPA: rhomboid family intramembrane serine protease, partial [Acidobacteriota bacterium]|nr:rhomboid family intramembrane serine protease [Acidobacteriota bacterium]